MKQGLETLLTHKHGEWRTYGGVTEGEERSPERIVERREG